MANRKYQQRLRAETAEETRRRILDAVEQRLREAPAEAVSLEQVAQLAKVARSTIYVVFGSRAGLFDAFAKDLWDRTGLHALTSAVAHPDARLHLRGGVTAASRMYAAEPDIYRAMFSMAKLDPDAFGRAVEAMQAERAGGMAHLARRLQEDGVLLEGVSLEEAVDVLWVLCSFESFDLLYTERGLSLEDTIERIVTTAERALCRPRRRRRTAPQPPARR